MNDVEIYGNLIEGFIKKMTSPEIGQFRLEVSTFRIILERARVEDPALVKFTITDEGKVINNLNDDPSSLESLTRFLQRSTEFIASLIGEELARDIIISSMMGDIDEISDEMKGRKTLLSAIPEPFSTLIRDTQQDRVSASDHDDILELFQDVFQAYIKDLSADTDLSAFKLKLSILREKHDLLKSVVLGKNNNLMIDKDRWSAGSHEEVSQALSALFNSMVGLSTFLVGKEEAVKKASGIFGYYFEGKEDLLMEYDLIDRILGGAMHSKVSTGIDNLDRKMGGGIQKGNSILLLSPSGIERDIFIYDMIKKGLENNSSTMMVTSKEPPRSVRMMLRSNGLDPKMLEEEGRFRIIDWYSWRGERIIGVEKDGHALKSSKILSNLGIAINKGLRELSYSSHKLGVIHIIAPATNIFEFNQVYNFIQRLRAKFKDEDMASIFLLESDALSRNMEARLNDVFDGCLEISKRSEEGRFKREIKIRSLSGVDFDGRPIPFDIKDNEILPEGEEEDISGVHQEETEKEIIPARSFEEPLLVLGLNGNRKGSIEVPVSRDEDPEPVTKKVKRKVKRKLKRDKVGKPDKETIPNRDRKRARLIRRKRIRIRKENNGNVDLDGVDLGIDGEDPEIVLKDAIDTIDDLLDSNGLEKKKVRPRKIRKKLK